MLQYTPCGAHVLNLNLKNVERIIALGPPSATGLEELYKTGQLSRHEVQSRTIAERRKQAEKVREMKIIYWVTALHYSVGTFFFVSWER